MASPESGLISEPTSGFTSGAELTALAGEHAPEADVGELTTDISTEAISIDGSLDEPLLPASPDAPIPATAATTEFIAGAFDISRDVRNEARSRAEQKLTEKLAEKSGVAGILHRIWEGNLARDYYLQREQQAALEEIRAEGRLYGEAGDGKDERAMSAVALSRIVELEEATPVGERLTESGAEASIKGSLKDLIAEFGKGEIDAAAFEAEKTRLFSEAAKHHPEIVGRGLKFADNMLMVAEAVKARFDTGAVMEELLAATQIYLGEARSGLHSEADLNRVDRIVDTLGRTRVGRLVNETTMGIAVSVAVTAFKTVSKSTVGAAAKSVGLIGVPSLLTAGLRENTRFKQERSQHMRDRATGNAAPTDNEKRRAEMEHSRYETKSASELSNHLGELVFSTDADGRRTPKILDAAQMKEAMTAIAEIQSRALLSAERNVDLISFSSIDNADTERFLMKLDAAEARVALMAMFESADPATKAAIAGGLNFEAFLTSQIAANRLELMTDIEGKDALFSRMKARSVAKAATKGLLTGIGIGVVSQEIFALASGSQHGALESALGRHVAGGSQGEGHQTLLRSILSRSHHGEHSSPTGLHKIDIGDGNAVKLPPGATMTNSPDGSFSLSLPGTNRIDGLLVKNGAFDQASLDRLHVLGINSAIQHVKIPGGDVTTTISTPDFLAKHPELVHRIHRQAFYDNNTGSPHFEKNELGLHWGGTNGLDDHGNYVFNVVHMRPDGSYHGNTSVDAQQLMNSGKMKVLLSATKGTQKTVFEVPVDAHGNAIITAGSPQAQLFSVQNGHAVFTGKYAEAAQSMGTGSDGAENVRLLATHIGAGKDTMTETFSPPVDKVVTSLFRTAVPRDVAVPPLIPIIARRGLEPARRPADEPATPTEPLIPEGGPEPETPEVGSSMDMIALKEAAREALIQLRFHKSIQPLERQDMAAGLGQLTQAINRGRLKENHFVLLDRIFTDRKVSDLARVESFSWDPARETQEVWTAHMEELKTEANKRYEQLMRELQRNRSLVFPADSSPIGSTGEVTDSGEHSAKASTPDAGTSSIPGATGSRSKADLGSAETTSENVAAFKAFQISYFSRVNSLHSLNNQDADRISSRDVSRGADKRAGLVALNRRGEIYLAAKLNRRKELEARDRPTEAA